ncbi:type II toxin-antitoxin system Phd/YefM family antitoxin [Betaproteobacteria bacterium PRO4]|uniref:hypothetical protein n=1 Tax=uncultured Nitrosomonas sp. TaxID=156424 RepID=UPI00255EFF7A|nr:hypothetical protein [uncultured Nitrosomonas sp.]MDL1867347.1 type II toxin-antitoxin system Phd/YefM family antitoxin [Betaproteobacteria bacterium PRO4]
MKLHPQIIEKEGRNEFVVLPYEEYLALTALIEDYEDLTDLRKARDESVGEASIPLEKIISGLDTD